MARVALHHGVSGLEAGVGDLGHVERLVVRLLSGDDWGVGHQREVDPGGSRSGSGVIQLRSINYEFGKPGVGNQVGLELVEIDIEGSVKPQ